MPLAGDMELPYKIILASNSPRRRELLGGLGGLGIPFTTRVLDGIDESWPQELKGEEISLYISREKASAYRKSIAPDELVITADTIVYVDGEVLGKPLDEADAKRMLHMISGRWHEVITGVTLMHRIDFVRSHIAGCTGGGTRCRDILQQRCSGRRGWHGKHRNCAGGLH